MLKHGFMSDMFHPVSDPEVLGSLFLDTVNKNKIKNNYTLGRNSFMSFIYHFTLLYIVPQLVHWCLSYHEVYVMKQNYKNC